MYDVLVTGGTVVDGSGGDGFRADVGIVDQRIEAVGELADADTRRVINAAGLAFIVAGARWSSPDGNTMFILIIAVAAAEAAIGLGLLLQLQKRFRTIDIDAASEMHG